jgi:hypothetical protein
MPDNPQLPLGRKYIKSFAAGTLNQFITSAAHYVWMIREYHVTEVEIDLLTLSIYPPLLDIERNRILAMHCQGSLLSACERLTPPARITAAQLTIHTNLSTTNHHQFRLTARDDMQHNHQVTAQWHQ